VLSQFRVEGLHGDKNLLVSLERDRLIVVGENGTGKSTLVNLIYYFITCQWTRLLEYRFQTIAARLGDNWVELNHLTLEKHQAGRVRLARHLPPSVVRNLRSRLGEQQLALFLDDEDAIFRLAAETHYPANVLRRALHDMQAESSTSDAMSSITKIIKSALPGQVLYLPTYRRIEHDLQSIFRGIDLESQLNRLRDQIGQGRQRGGYVELVEFGMQDVEATVRTRLAAVKDSLREGLSNLTATYLRDVIRGIHAKADSQSVLALDLTNLDAMLARLDEATLPVYDKVRLRDRVISMQSRAQITAEDSVVVHFLSKLLELQHAQQLEESVLERFVTTCNRYLVGKRLHFDNLDYKLYIAREEGGPSIQDKDSQTLSFKHLSSGEKQIVSLFSHIYLSGRNGFYVIIDEPELSLSVPWQRRFLPDILETGMCSGLIAVTHSPFVWENDLESHVHSMAEFAEAARVAN
jgi:predicted ATPase